LGTEDIFKNKSSFELSFHGEQINEKPRCAQTAQQRGKTMEHKSTKPAAVPKPHSKGEKPWSTNQQNPPLCPNRTAKRKNHGAQIKQTLSLYPNST